jgi:predicted O-methyltransferase YrrM
MAHRFFRAYRHLEHALCAQRIMRVHSPFVFALLTEVLRDKRQYYAFGEIAALRQQLEADQSVLEFADYGATDAGLAQSAAQAPTVHRTVSQLAKRAGCPPKLGRMLFRLVEREAPEHILELGTSLGLGTRYLAEPQRHQQLITIEGAASIAQKAAEHLQHIPGVDQRIGPFSRTLEPALDDLGRLDLAYLDGHHTEAASLKMVRQCLPYCHPNSILILDDIRWSPGMWRAWHALCTSDAVRLSIDLGRCGMLLFRAEQRQKEHYRLAW